MLLIIAIINIPVFYYTSVVLGFSCLLFTYEVEAKLVFSLLARIKYRNR